jgi:signal peptidase I
MSGTRLAVPCTALATAITVLGLTWARRHFVLVTVKGDSMAPAFRNGDRVILHRGGYRVGDVIMFRAPAYISSLPYGVEWIMKRAVAIAGDPVPADLADRAGTSVVPAGQLLVRSDAPNGLDSRQLGLIDDRDVVGIVRGSPRRTHSRMRIDRQGPAATLAVLPRKLPVLPQVVLPGRHRFCCPR